MAVDYSHLAILHAKRTALLGLQSPQHAVYFVAQVCIPTHDSQRFYSTNDLCALGHGTSSSGGSGTAAAPSPSDSRYGSCLAQHRSRVSACHQEQGTHQGLMWQ